MKLFGRSAPATRGRRAPDGARCGLATTCAALFGAALCGTLAMHGGTAEAQLAAEDVAATVGGEALHVSELIFALRSAGQGGSGQVAPAIAAQMLETVVNQRLVERGARRLGFSADEPAIDEQLSQLKSQLAARKLTFEAWLAERGIDEPALRAQLAISVLLNKYAASRLTDEAVTQYFEAHRAELDGSRARVSHILLRADGSTSATALQALVTEARRIRVALSRDEITFADAARRYSAAPSRRRGGSVGLLDRSSPWAENFVLAALALKPGEVSQPVVSPSGVHLILCEEVESGTKPLAEVRPQIEERLKLEALAQLAAEERKTTAIEYSGKWPFFRPGTLEVVMPSSGEGGEKPRAAEAP